MSSLFPFLFGEFAALVHWGFLYLRRMLNKLTDAILYSEDLDDRDKVLLLQVNRLQLENGRVTQGELALKCRISVPTVTRRLRRIREMGLMTVERQGAHRWTYDLSPFLRLEEPCSTPS